MWLARTSKTSLARGRPSVGISQNFIERSSKWTSESQFAIDRQKFSSKRDKTSWNKVVSSTRWNISRLGKISIQSTAIKLNFFSHILIQLFVAVFGGILGNGETLLLLLVRMYDKEEIRDLFQAQRISLFRNDSTSSTFRYRSLPFRIHVNRRTQDSVALRFETRNVPIAIKDSSLEHSQGREKQAEGGEEEGQSVIVIRALIILRCRGIGWGSIRKRPQGELSERADMTFKSPLFSVSRLRREDEIGSNSD